LDIQKIPLMRDHIAQNRIAPPRSHNTLYRSSTLVGGICLEFAPCLRLTWSLRQPVKTMWFRSGLPSFDRILAEVQFDWPMLVVISDLITDNVDIDGDNLVVLSKLSRLIYSRLKQFYGNLSSHLLGLLGIWYPDLVQLHPPLLSYVGRL